jgi:hypothetical protein
LDAGVLPNGQGWAVHAGFQPDFGLETLRQARCHPHPRRQLQFRVEQPQLKGAPALQPLLLTRKRHGDERSSDRSAARIHAFEAPFEALLTGGLPENPLLPRPPNRHQRIAQHPATN